MPANTQTAGWVLITDAAPTQNTIFYHSHREAVATLLDILTTDPRNKKEVKPAIRTGYAYQNKLHVCRSRDEIRHWGHVARGIPTQSIPLSTLENSGG